MNEWTETGLNNVIELDWLNNWFKGRKKGEKRIGKPSRPFFQNKPHETEKILNGAVINFSTQIWLKIVDKKMNKK